MPKATTDHDITADHIDRLVTVEMRARGWHRGLARAMYKVLREEQGDRPYTLLAAEKIVEHVRHGDYVLLLTGAGSAPWRPKGETDGPTGAATLARSIKLGIGGRPAYVSAEHLFEPIIACSHALGITVVEDRDMAEYDGFYPTALKVVFPLGKEGPEEAAVAILDELNPKVIIAVECLGPNEGGMIHSARGYTKNSDEMHYTYFLMEEGRKRGIPTIGIGDVGNEVGFGRFLEELKEVRKDFWGQSCRPGCPCGGYGNLSTTASDVAVYGSISDWGAYGVAACLALLLGDIDVLHTPQMERKMLEDCVAAGAEGSRGFNQPYLDNTSVETQEAMITMLRMLVETGLAPPKDRPF